MKIGRRYSPPPKRPRVRSVDRRSARASGLGRLLRDHRSSTVVARIDRPKKEDVCFHAQCRVSDHRKGPQRRQAPGKADNTLDDHTSLFSNWPPVTRLVPLGRSHRLHSYRPNIRLHRTSTCSAAIGSLSHLTGGVHIRRLGRPQFKIGKVLAYLLGRRV
jgi:hypothetical protein